MRPLGIIWKQWCESMVSIGTYTTGIYHNWTDNIWYGNQTWLENRFFIPLVRSFSMGPICLWVNTYRYIFSGMNIHLPAILMFTRGTRFWHTAISSLQFGDCPATFPVAAEVKAPGCAAAKWRSWRSMAVSPVTGHHLAMMMIWVWINTY